MKRNLTTVITILFLFLIPSVVSAQKTNTDDTNQNIIAPITDEIEMPNPEVESALDSLKGKDPFNIVISLGTQNPWSKKIPIYLDITSVQNATRVQIAWDSALGLNIVGNYPEYFPMTAGETRRFEGTIDPEKAGSYLLTANVTDWGYGKNYTSSEYQTLTLDESLVTVPKTENFQTYQIVLYIIILIVVVLIILVMIVLGKKLIVILKEWLKPPEF